MSALDELNDPDNWSNWFQWIGNRSLQLEIVPELTAELEALRAENARLSSDFDDIRSELTRQENENLRYRSENKSLKARYDYAIRIEELLTVSPTWTDREKLIYSLVVQQFNLKEGEE